MLLCENVIWALLDFKRNLLNIYDNIDVVWVANEIKPCGMKKLSSTVVNNFIMIKASLAI